MRALFVVLAVFLGACYSPVIIKDVRDGTFVDCAPTVGWTVEQLHEACGPPVSVVKRHGDGAVCEVYNTRAYVSAPGEAVLCLETSTWRTFNRDQPARTKTKVESIHGLRAADEAR